MCSVRLSSTSLKSVKRSGRFSGPFAPNRIPGRSGSRSRRKGVFRAGRRFRPDSPRHHAATLTAELKVSKSPRALYKAERVQRKAGRGLFFFYFFFFVHSVGPSSRANVRWERHRSKLPSAARRLDARKTKRLCVENGREKKTSHFSDFTRGRGKKGSRVRTLTAAARDLSEESADSRRSVIGTVVQCCNTIVLKSRTKTTKYVRGFFHDVIVRIKPVISRVRLTNYTRG